MSRSIFNNQTLGQYDFFTQSIELNNEAFNLDEQDVLRIINIEEPFGLKGKELKFYTTYLHELIHFFDCNSTLWGLEFSARMYRYYGKPQFEQAYEVVTLNESEIAMHNYLLNSKCRPLKLNFDSVKYQLDYTRSLGTHVNFKYLKYTEGKTVIIHSVALSMLALLEGHAYSQEQLFKLKAYQFQNDIISEKLLYHEIKSLIIDSNSCEYTCILAFVFQLFPDLSLKNKLELLVVLTKLVLNAPTIMISNLPIGLLEKVFKLSHPVLISAIKMELSRGMNRSTLLLILIMYLGYHNDISTLQGGENFIDKIETIILNVFMNDYQKREIKNSMLTFWEIEYDSFCKHLYDLDAGLTYMAAIEMKEKPWYVHRLKNLKVPPFFLSNTAVIKPENSLGINVEEHFDNICGSATDLENKLKGTPPKKAHLNPFIAYDWLKNIKTGQKNVTFYPEFFTFR